MGKYLYAVLILGILLVYTNPVESVALLGGAEVDDEGQRFSYVGAQTDGKIFFHLFAGDLKYDFEDNNKIREAKLKFITPAIGFRKEGPLTLTFVAGPTFREKEEKQDVGSRNKTESGGFFQLGSYHWQEDQTFEFLVSYTSLDSFLWSRLRGRHRIKDRWFGGADLFWMGNDDFDGWGLGPVIEYAGKRASITLKTGYKHTTTYKGGFYTGIELYTTF